MIFNKLKTCNDISQWDQAIKQYFYTEASTAAMPTCAGSVTVLEYPVLRKSCWTGIAMLSLSTKDPTTLWSRCVIEPFPTSLSAAHSPSRWLPFVCVYVPVSAAAHPVRACGPAPTSLQTSLRWRSGSCQSRGAGPQQTARRTGTRRGTRTHRVRGARCRQRHPCSYACPATRTCPCRVVRRSGTLPRTRRRWGTRCGPARGAAWRRFSRQHTPVLATGTPSTGPSSASPALLPSSDILKFEFTDTN